MAHPKQLTKRPRPVALKTVPSGRTRQRLRTLSQNGIGRKAVHEVTSIDLRTLARIKSGQTKYVRRETMRLIFSVPFDAHCDRAVISGTKTRRMIEHLITHEDFTGSEIAKRLGTKQTRRHKTLNIGRNENVLAKSQMRIEKLYRDAVA